MSAARRAADGKRPAWRREVRASDLEHVRAIVSSTGFFHPPEVDVAVELVQERLTKGAASGYEFVFPPTSRKGAAPSGYACFGPIAGTETSYDLYWIAVHAAERRRGLGRALLEEAEATIASSGGRRVWVETSARELYAPTRAFYEAAGYERAALLADFYAEGDGKLVYVKRLAPRHP